MGNSLIWIPKRLVELGLLNVAAQSPRAFIDYCEADYTGLCQKQQPNIPQIASQRLHNPDLFCSLRDRHNHRVGNTDRRNNQRDRPKAAQHHLLLPRFLFHRRADALH